MLIISLLVSLKWNVLAIGRSCASKLGFHLTLSEVLSGCRVHCLFPHPSSVLHEDNSTDEDDHQSRNDDKSDDGTVVTSKVESETSVDQTQ